MKRLVYILFVALGMLIAVPIQAQVCHTCKKALSNCQYNGNHPTKTTKKKPTPPKKPTTTIKGSSSNKQTSIKKRGTKVVTTYDDITVEPSKPTQLKQPEPSTPSYQSQQSQTSTSPTSVLTEKEVNSIGAHMPSFPGGEATLLRYIGERLRYPQIAQDNNIQGKVVLQFVVEKDGSIGEVKVVRSVDKDLDREAVRVAKSLPRFSPGRWADGTPVRVWYTLPVIFKLQGTND